MARILGVVILILAVLLFPPAVLALISNNALPGDATYPIKRKLEEGILALAAVNPTAKAWFSVTRSNRRFDEAKLLLAEGKAADQTLSELVSQTDVAANQITQLSSQQEKQQYINNLSQSITKYKSELREVSQKSTTGTTALPTPAASSHPLPTSAAPTAVAATQPGVSAKPTFSPRPTASAVVTARPSTTPAASAVPIPTASVRPAVTPTAQPLPPPQTPAPPTAPATVDKTIKDLDDIQKKVEEERKKFVEKQKEESEKQQPNKPPTAGHDNQSTTTQPNPGQNSEREKEQLKNKR